MPILYDDQKDTSGLKVVDVDGDGFVDFRVDKMVDAAGKTVELESVKNILMHRLNDYCFSKVPRGFQFDFTAAAKARLEKLLKEVRGGIDQPPYYTASLQPFEVNGQKCQVLEIMHPTYSVSFQRFSCYGEFDENKQQCSYDLAAPYVDFLDGAWTFTRKTNSNPNGITKKTDW